MPAIVITFQKFANWKEGVAIYSENPDDDFNEIIAEIIPNPPLDQNQEINFDLISAFDRCPNDCAIFIYKSNFADTTEEDFYQDKHEGFQLIYGTDVDFVN